MKKFYLLLIVGLVVAGLVGGSFGCAAPSAPPTPKEEVKPIVLKAVSTWEKSMVWNDKYLEFIDRVNKQAVGKLKIEWVGGPEVVPVYEAVDPVGRGVFHVWRTATTFCGGFCPELLALDIVPAPWEAKVKTGAVDLIDSILRKKNNLTILGSIGGGALQYHIYLLKPVSKMSDLAGRKLRSGPLYDGLVTGLGAVPVTIPPAETYTALERGVVDGICWVSMGMVERKLEEVVKYMVFPGWYDVIVVVLMNAQTWDGLPKDLQKLVRDIIAEMNVSGAEYFRGKVAAELEIMKKAGVQVTELPPEEARRFLEIATTRGWETNVIAKSPEYGKKLQEMLSPLAKK